RGANHWVWPWMLTRSSGLREWIRSGCCSLRPVGLYCFPHAKALLKDCRVLRRHPGPSSCCCGSCRCHPPSRDITPLVAEKGYVVAELLRGQAVQGPEIIMWGLSIGFRLALQRI